MSLYTRLLGVALTLVGGWLMGSAQGLITISNYAGNTIFNLSKTTPAVGVITGNFLENLVEQQLTPNYGTFWVFGVLLAIGGLAFIGRGDRKPRPASESIPLLTEPLYPKPPE